MVVVIYGSGGREWSNAIFRLRRDLFGGNRKHLAIGHLRGVRSKSRDRVPPFLGLTSFVIIPSFSVNHACL